MNFNKIVEHCIKHKFLNPNHNQFAFLGDALQHRIEQEWLANNVTLNNNALYINSDSITHFNVKLLELFTQASAFMGSDTSISLASLTRSQKVGGTVKEPNKVSELLDSLPQTLLNLCTLSHPAHKIDEFTRLQKARRRWWKSYLQQPVLLNTTAVDLEDDPFLEQRIEFNSTAMGPEPMEVLRIYKPEVFESLLGMNEDLKKSLMVKFQRKSMWPVLMTSQMRLEQAVWFFLTDAFYVRNKTPILSLHKSLAPFPVGIVLEGTPTRSAELEDLRRLFSLDFRLARIPVLPLSAHWTIAQCDARGVPFLICLSDSTLEQGICGLRSRDTTLKEEVHVGNVAERLKNFLIR